MAGVPRISIKKKEYRFDIRKRYQNVRSYKVRTETPQQKIQRFVKGLFEKKKPKKKAFEKKRFVTEAKPGFNIALAGATVGLAIFLILFVWIYLTLQSYQGPSGPIPSFEKPGMRNTVFGGDIITAGDRHDGTYIASILLDYSAENVDFTNVSIATYDKKLPSEVFVLESSRKEADSYPDFIRSLRAILSEKNIRVNEITFDELEEMPAGAVVLVPSGYIPKELIGSGTQITPNMLAAKGTVVIYCGNPFTKMLDGESLSTIPQSLRENIPFTFDERTALTPSGINLVEPRYSVSGSGGWSTSTAYGAISIVTKGDGAFVFVPQTLDGGWIEDEKPGYEYAAEDIAKVIIEMPWASPDGAARTSSLSEGSGRVYLFSDPFKGTEKSVVLRFTGVRQIKNEQNITVMNVTVEDTKIVRVKKAQRGEIYISGGYAVVSSSISTQPVRMYGSLAEPTSGQANMFLVIENATGSEVLRDARGRISTQEDVTMDINVNLPKGEYTAALLDDADKVYAASYLVVSGVDITRTGSQRSSYYFSLTMNGVPVALKTVKVTVDGGDYGTYEYHDDASIEVDVGSYTGGNALPAGDHTFTFEIGGLTEDVNLKVETPIPPIFENPLFISAIVFSALIAGVGIIFARREEIYFSIDIPDFPLTAREKIPISPDVILSIFEKVNSSYKWSYTPLRLAEIKSGFRDIFYKGKPVYITDYNTEFLLEKLKSKNQIKEALGYYAPVHWEGKTRKSAAYLALLRALRDICINNAIPFTVLGESKKADSEIDVMGQKMFVHFYDRFADAASIAKLFKNAISTVPEGITIILFKDEFEKDRFRPLLDSPTIAQLLLRFEVESSSVLLLSVSELEKMIRELKVV